MLHGAKTQRKQPTKAKTSQAATSNLCCFAPCTSLGQAREESVRLLREPSPNFHSKEDQSSPRLHADELRAPSFLRFPGCKDGHSIHLSGSSPWSAVAMVDCQLPVVERASPSTTTSCLRPSLGFAPDTSTSRTNACVHTTASLSANACGYALARNPYGSTPQREDIQHDGGHETRRRPHRHARPVGEAPDEVSEVSEPEANAEEGWSFPCMLAWV